MMSGTPTASNNDAGTGGAGSSYPQQPQQQQHGPLQQRPMLSPQHNSGSSPSLRRQYSNPTSDHGATSSRGTTNDGSNSSNGYAHSINNVAMRNSDDTTSDRQRTEQQQQTPHQTTMISHQISQSPRRVSGVAAPSPAYGNNIPPYTGNGVHPSLPSSSPSDSVPTKASSAPSQQQHNVSGIQPIPSPQQQYQQQQQQLMMHMQSHQQHQMSLQQQQQQHQMQHQLNQQQHYQSYNIPQAQQGHRDSTNSSNSSTGNSNSIHKQLPYGDNRNSSMHQPGRISDNDDVTGISNQHQRSQIKHSNINNSFPTGAPLPAIPMQPGSPLKSGAPNASNRLKVASPSLPVSSSSGSASKSNANNSTNNANAASSAVTATSPQLPPEKVAALLSRCSWVDKTIWASRQLLGGQAVNGFMRSTATVQRIKKQRARQNVKSGKSKITSNNNNNIATAAGSADGGGESSGITPPTTTTQSLVEQQAEEEVLKTEIMNARTAKKIRQELDGGIQFCVLLHDTIRSIIQQMDPSLPQVEPLSSSPYANRPTAATKAISAAPTYPSIPPATLTMQNGAGVAPKSGINQKPAASTTSNAIASTKSSEHGVQPSSNPTHGGSISTSSHVSPHNATGSTLRRHRRTKLAPSGETLLQLAEIDETTGKKHSSKKDQPHRLSEVIRFRALRQGDPVAARVTSRDLWILARVVKDYPGTNLTPIEFLRLSASRREQLFKEKVLIQDVEEHDGSAAAAVLVARTLVLPLPRNVSEAAEWGNIYRFYKKGSRVYAMYPQTTSLYTATVVDCTTYCRRDDDIIVVEFDGDDPDPETGKLPACHIPARFVTLIPKEFPGIQAPTAAATISGVKSSAASSNKRKRNEPVVNSMDADIMNGVLDDLNFDEDLPGLDQFDDLDFDLLGDG